MKEHDKVQSTAPLPWELISDSDGCHSNHELVVACYLSVFIVAGFCLNLLLW